MYRRVAFDTRCCSIDDWADRLIENVVGTVTIPVGSVPVTVNGHKVVLPICFYNETDHACLTSLNSGHQVNQSVQVTDSIMVGQIQLLISNNNPWDLSPHKQAILDAANKLIPSQVERGGGVRDVWIQTFEDGDAVLEFTIDVRDAMGANMVNTVVEGLKPDLEKRLPDGWRQHVRILSNDGQFRTATVTQAVPENFTIPSDFYNRIKRAVHQMLVALSNDWRASDIAISTFFKQQPDGVLLKNADGGNGMVLSVKVPVIVGIVGRVTEYPFAKSMLDQLKPNSAMTLGGWIACAAVRIALHEIPRESTPVLLWDDAKSEAKKQNQLPPLRDLSVSARRDTIGLQPAPFLDPVPGAKLPLGILPNLKINSQLVHLPYAVEEPSIGAAIANAAKRTELAAITESDDTSISISITATVTMVNDSDRFMDAARFSVLNERRAMTNNKGVFNGVDSVLVAFGIDPTQIRFQMGQPWLDFKRVYPLVIWEKKDETVIGTLDVRLEKGRLRLINAIDSAPLRQVLGINRIEDALVGAFCAGVLANWSALNALATVGINNGHMPLHHRSKSTHECAARTPE